MIATRVGADIVDWPLPDGNTAADLADKYDVLYFLDQIEASVMNALKAAKPNIILLQYDLPGGAFTKTKWPGSYYVRGRVSGLKVKNSHGVWLSNLADPVARKALMDDIIVTTSLGSDGHWLDVSHPRWLNVPWLTWVDENGKCADLGDLDGGWDCSKPRSTALDYDGTWKTHMLNFHKEFKAKVPGKIRLFNGMPSTKGGYTSWQGPYDDTIAVMDGVVWEEALVKETGPLSENDWKWTIDKAKALIGDLKYVYFMSKRMWEARYRTYAFASYLLFAEGKYAWFHIFQPHYDASLFAVDYGTPLGPYTVISTPNGPIYKREFTKATVWVNPGEATRSATGKTLNPKSAIIETK